MSLSKAAILAAMLMLGACAAPGPEARRTVPAPGGVWEVTEAVAMSPMPAPSPYVGQRIALYGDLAGDPSGQICREPLYQGFEAAPALVLGTRGDTQSRPVLEVVCFGETFGTYVAVDDDRLKTRVNAWLLTLERASDLPPIATSEPRPIVAVAQAAPAPTVSPGRLVYLASYKNEATAKAGFATLTRHSAILARLPMVTRDLDLGARGTWIRLYAQTADNAEAARLCAELKPHLAGCDIAWARTGEQR